MYAKLSLEDIVVDVMKMGNTVPKAGIEPRSLAFSVHIGSLMSPICPCLPDYAATSVRGQYSLLHSSHRNCKSFNTHKFRGWDEMGNMGIEPRHLAFRVSVLTIIPPRLPAFSTLPTRGECSLVHYVHVYIKGW